MELLRLISIRKRFFLLLALALVAIITIAISTIFIFKDALYEFKKHGVSQIVVAASGVPEYFYEQEKLGLMTREEAQTHAMGVVSKMRFDNSNYIAVGDFDYHLLSHPNKDIVNVDLSGLKDKKGISLIDLHMRSMDNSKGEGFSYYWWAKPGETEPDEKYAFQKRFAPWDWYLGSGDYSDAIDDVVGETVSVATTMIIFAAIVLFVISIFLIYSILGPLRKTVSVLDDVNSESIDLTLRLDESGQDELVNVAVNFNEIQGSVGQVIVDLGSENQQLNSLVSDLVVVSKNTQSGNDRQRAELEQLVTAVNQISATVNEVAKNTSQAAEMASETNQHMQNSRGDVDDSMQFMGDLTEAISESKVTMSELLETASRVNTVLDVINGIAEQTNLLALNAAIEAARAGEQGRGFAVVADEVRSLAGRVQESTKEIDGIIQGIHSGVQDTSNNIDSVVDVATKANEKVKDTGEALTQVIGLVTQISDLNMQIATAAEEQAATTDEINRNVVAINDLSHDMQEDEQRVTNAVDTLSGMASQITAMMKRFKV
ncbi:MAG: methyl-accepting chemotaxis protein [Cellvibrionaceae bacterium]